MTTRGTSIKQSLNYIAEGYVWYMPFYMSMIGHIQRHWIEDGTWKVKKIGLRKIWAVLMSRLDILLDLLRKLAKKSDKAGYGFIYAWHWEGNYKSVQIDAKALNCLIEN